MKNLILLFSVCFLMISCKKETIKPNPVVETVSDTLQVSEFVNVSFNDIFGSGLDSVYIFKNNVFVKTIAVGCGNSFKAELNVNYSFKKKHKDSLVPLYGYQATTDTYLIFLTTNNKPKYCTDYLQNGLSVGIVITESEYKCNNVHYTLNTWF